MGDPHIQLYVKGQPICELAKGRKLNFVKV